MIAGTFFLGVALGVLIGGFIGDRMLVRFAREMYADNETLVRRLREYRAGDDPHYAMGLMRGAADVLEGK